MSNKETELLIFRHNIVFKFGLSSPIERAIAATVFGGTYTTEDHAGPTSVSFTGDVKATFRLFKENKVILSGCKSLTAALVAIWNLCARITLALSTRGVIERISPINITKTNTQAVGYFPFTLDLKRLATMFPDVTYSPEKIAPCRIRFNLGRKITCSVFKSGAIVWMGGDDDLILETSKLIKPALHECRLTAVDPASKRNIQVSEYGSAEIDLTETMYKRRKRREFRSKV